MADRINFIKNINDSVQIGDELFYSSSGGSPTSIGVITDIGEKYVEVGGEINGIIQTANTPIPFDANTMFFMFQKPVEQNVSSLKGYHAEVKFVNTSGEKQELFAVGSEITISSK